MLERRRSIKGIDEKIMEKSDAKIIKELNKKLIRKAFYEAHIRTAAELSLATGLSVVTTNALLREMIEDNEVLLSTELVTNGGRPAARYQYNEFYQCTAVVYGYQKNNKDFITMIVTDIFGKCVLRECTTMINITDRSFENMLDKAFLEFPMIRIVAFGLPGEEDEGTILYNDYKGIVGNSFMKHYEDRYQVPVLFVNDVNAAVNGYYHKKAYPDKNVVGIFFPRLYYPGAGIIINGEIYTGLRGFAGEIGFLPNGIKWEELDYQDEDIVLDAVSNVIAILSCVAAPDRFVLYGDFFQKGSKDKLEKKINSMLQNQYTARIDISAELAGDIEYGLICQASRELQNVEGLIE